MTKLLFIAATTAEIAPIERALALRYPCVVSGIGATATAIATLRAIDRHKPDLVVQLGIAGAVDRALEVGQVVIVASDYQADHGAWRAERQQFVGFSPKIYHNEFHLDRIARVSARSVATACTPLVSDNSQIETMEGAAFFAAADACNTPSAQIRSISNYVGDAREMWRIDEAIERLKDVVVNNF